VKRVYRAGILLITRIEEGNTSLECIQDGCIQVVGSRIEKVGPSSEFSSADGSVTDLGGGVLMPGLINAHCHLELGFTQGKLAFEGSFTTWVTQLQQSFGVLQKGEIEKNIQHGIHEALCSGTTTLVDVGNTGKALELLSDSPLREYAYWEALGLDPQGGIERLETYLEQCVDYSGRQGISAHAPFSCSPDLLRRVIKEMAHNTTMPFTMHLGESKEEHELFVDRKGALYDFCFDKYPQVPGLKVGSGWSTPFEYVLAESMVPQKSLMVHCNTVDTSTLEAFQQKHVSIVHCPRSHAFFDHPLFPYSLCKEMQVNVCLGTDSLASNSSLSMFDEIAFFKNQYPDISYEEILCMATLNGAKALNKGQELGVLKEGYLADCVYMDCPQKKGYTNKEVFLENLVSKSHNIQWSMIHGREVSL
jgi:cytosine/adenosine deaminase-related metal-dependent hydrolase